MLGLRVKLKEVEASVEIRKEGLEEAEEDWRSRLGEQLDVVEQLQQVKHNFAKYFQDAQRPVDLFSSLSS